MKLKFYGTRGSMPAPVPDTLLYGGNTTCIALTGDAGERIILDGGSGIRVLGLELARRMPVECSIFISHTHWDHIHGLPFFVPLFVAGNRITILGPPDPLAMQGIENVLLTQLAYPHFPVRVAELKSSIAYETLRDRQTVRVGSLTISAILMNHPALCFGFRVQGGGKSLFFTGDHEPFGNIYAPGDPEYEEYAAIVRERNEGIVEFIRGVDLLVADSQYTDEEYKTKFGWGHSTFEQCIGMAKAAGIGRVCLTHHETTRTDAELSRIGEELLRRHAGEDIEIRLAEEGADIEI